MDIFVFEDDQIHPLAIQALQLAGWVVWTPDQLPPPGTMISALMVRSYTMVDQALLDQFPQVKYVLRVGVGLDNIDLKVCQNRQITVFNSPGSNAQAVAEHVLLLLLLMVRDYPRQSQRITQGQWRDPQALGYELNSLSLGVIGCGAIGELVIKKAAALGMKSIFTFDPRLSPAKAAGLPCQLVGLPELLAQSQVVSLHVPLNAHTHHLIGANELAQMPKGSYLINTARGGVVDEEAVISALDAQHLAGAAFDVFENEPELNPVLRQHPSMICTPHMAALTHEAYYRMSMDVVEHLLRVT